MEQQETRRSKSLSCWKRTSHEGPLTERPTERDLSKRHRQCPITEVHPERPHIGAHTEKHHPEALTETHIQTPHAKSTDRPPLRNATRRPFSETSHTKFTHTLARRSQAFCRSLSKHPLTGAS